MKKIPPFLLLFFSLVSCKSSYHNPIQDKREEILHQDRQEIEIELQQEMWQQDQQ